MLTFARPVIVAALFALGAVVLGGAPAGAQDQQVAQQSPAVSGEAQNVGSTSVTLTGTVSGAAGTVYHFDYGTTLDYGSSTATGTLPMAGTESVFASVEGLTPGTTYYYRLVASNPDTPDVTDVGEAHSFITSDAAAAGDAPTTPVQGAQPEINESVAVAPVEGDVKVKEPGTGEFNTLPVGEEVRLGSVVDARDGAVKLTSELPGGRTQTATFGDGLFQVRQSKTHPGLIDIILRGGNFSVCRTRGRGLARVQARGSARARAAIAIQSRKRPKRRLWAKDRGGRFRTHGRNSVATVRGTRWVTTDTCKGTRTTVTSGSVSVRNLQTERTVIVRKGKSYLARGRR